MAVRNSDKNSKELITISAKKIRVNSKFTLKKSKWIITLSIVWSREFSLGKLHETETQMIKSQSFRKKGEILKMLKSYGRHKLGMYKVWLNPIEKENVLKYNWRWIENM